MNAEIWAVDRVGLEEFRRAQATYAGAIAAAGRKTNIFGDPLPEISMVGQTAVVPVRGLLLATASPLAKLLGAMSYGDIQDMLGTAAGSGAKSIVLDIASPGGTVAGCPETAAAVAEIDKTIPVTAYCGPVCASAALWLASGARKVVASPSSSVGSIGVVAEYMNISSALDKAGIKNYVFTSAELKAAGSPSVPMTPEAAGAIQKRINEAGGMFAQWIKTRRRGVAESAFTGEVFFAGTAQKLGLIDGIVGSLEAAIVGAPKLATSAPAAATPRALFDSPEAQARHDWETSAELRKQFSSPDTLLGWRRAVAKGSVRLSLEERAQHAETFQDDVSAWVQRGKTKAQAIQLASTANPAAHRCYASIGGDF